MTYCDGIIHIADSSVSHTVDGLLKVVQATKCLLITEEGKYYTNPVWATRKEMLYTQWNDL